VLLRTPGRSPFRNAQLGLKTDVMLNQIIPASPRAGLPIALLVAGLFTLGCEDESPSLGTVAGALTEIGSGDPVADAGVLLVSASSMIPAAHLARTDRQGRYRIEGVTPGDYAVFLYHARFTTFDRSLPLVHVDAGESSRQDMRLIDWGLASEDRYWINGVVIDEEGDPLPDAFVEPNAFALSGADVVALFRGIAHPFLGITDEEGRFSIQDLVHRDEIGNSIGLGPITVVRDGYEPYTLVGPGEGSGPLGPPIPLPPDPVLEVTIRLRRLSPSPPGAVRGRVANVLTGAPVPNVLVGLSVLSSSPPDTFGGREPAPVPLPGKVATTNAAGEFRIDGLSPGVYVVAPAYLDGDGFVADDGAYRLPIATITEGDTAVVDMGEVPVVDAIRPLAPAPRSEITDLSPEFVWQPYPTGANYAPIDYELFVASTEYFMHPEAAFLTEPRWEGTTFAPGDHVRWSVSARVSVGSPPDTVRLFVFENTPTFTVAGP